MNHAPRLPSQRVGPRGARAASGPEQCPRLRCVTGAGGNEEARFAGSGDTTPARYSLLDRRSGFLCVLPWPADFLNHRKAKP